MKMVMGLVFLRFLSQSVPIICSVFVHFRIGICLLNMMLTLCSAEACLLGCSTQVKGNVDDHIYELVFDFW